MPVSSAIVLVPEATLESAEYGKVARAHALWPAYRAFLDRAVDDMYVGFYGRNAGA
jgi:hypothetical protein